MTDPTVRMIERAPTTRHEGWDPDSLRPADWGRVRELLGEGPGPCWLTATADHGPHVRPVFAAWGGETFVVASNPAARKSAALRADGRCSIAVDLSELHLVVEGSAARLSGEPDLRRASATLEQVFGWPTRVTGDRLDADGAAPSSGGPPFDVYEIHPARAYAFPTADQFEPTRWTWP